MIKKLIGQAIVQYLNGDKELFKAWVDEAIAEYDRETEAARLYATIEEILRSKGVVMDGYASTDEIA
jgi:hypothetical protein